MYFVLLLIKIIKNYKVEGVIIMIVFEHNDWRIDFIKDKNSNEWLVNLKDLKIAFNISDKFIAKIPEQYKYSVDNDLCNFYLNEKGLYWLLIKLEDKNLEKFQDWLLDILVSIRKLRNLKDYQALKMINY